MGEAHVPKAGHGAPGFWAPPIVGRYWLDRTTVPGRTSLGALTFVLGSVVESFKLTIFLSASTGKVAT